MVRPMRIDLLSIPMFAAVVTIAVVTMTAPADARRGGGNDFMNSPGYQRALQESRKRYQEQYLRQQADPPRYRRVKRHRR